MRSAVSTLLLMLSLPLAAGNLNVFTIDDANPPNGLYRPDIQASYPEVDWQTLDVLCIPAGQYKFIRMANLPQRNASRPLTITNCGGQVRVGGLGHYYLFSIGGGSNWRLSGHYSADEGTGDPAFPGHEFDNYANSAGRYGILVDDERTSDGPSGISIGGGATDFEVDFIEVRRVGFAGMSIKTDDDGAATMDRVRIHDTYVHDTGSEGFYIGSTQTQPQHPLTNLKFYNNRVVRTGTEIFQFGQIGDGCEVYNNVFFLGALEWKNPFQAYQDGGTQIGPRFGSFSFRNNIVIGAASALMQFAGAVIPGDPHSPGDLVEVRNNYFSNSRHFAAYIARLTDPDTTYRFVGNRYRLLEFQREELDPGTTDFNQFLRMGSGGTANTSPIEITDNQYDGSQFFINHWADPNQTSGSLQAIGNVAVVIPPVRFVDSGFPADYDYFRIESWKAQTSGGAPISYPTDDLASEEGTLYRCASVSGCGAGMLPSENPSLWSLLPAPPDDLRVHSDSPIQGVGLLDEHEPWLLLRSGFEDY